MQLHEIDYTLKKPGIHVSLLKVASIAKIDRGAVCDNEIHMGEQLQRQRAAITVQEID